MESWNDDRLDELSRRMDAGFKAAATKEEANRRFDEVNARLDRFEGSVGSRFDKVDAQLLHINDRLDRMNNTLLIGTLGVIAALIANGIFG